MLLRLFKVLISFYITTIIITSVGCGQSGPLYLPDKDKEKHELKN